MLEITKGTLAMSSVVFSIPQHQSLVVLAHIESNQHCGMERICLVRLYRSSVHLSVIGFSVFMDNHVKLVSGHLAPAPVGWE